MDRTERIAVLNDQLRRHHVGGSVMVTRGIQALGEKAVAEVLAAVAAFTAFTPDNDQFSERDCAVLDTAADHPGIHALACCGAFQAPLYCGPLDRRG